MVFAVNPSNLPGDNVHPLARSFEDFLRLILSCGLDAAEQAWMWNRGEFDAFMETYPPGPKQRAALDGLRDGLGLTPMEDPYGYIREVQYGFDYSKIPYSEEYYDLVPEKTQAETVNPKLTALNVELAQVEDEIEKLLNTLTGASAVLISCANGKIEDLDNNRQRLIKEIAALNAETVSPQKIELLSSHLDNWDNIDFEDRRQVADMILSQVYTTGGCVSFEWKI